MRLLFLPPTQRRRKNYHHCSGVVCLLFVELQPTGANGCLSRYDSRDYMTGAHRRSSPFQKLKGYLFSVTIGIEIILTCYRFEAKNGTRSQKSLNFIISPSGGFLERETPSNIPVADQYVRIVKMTCSPETRSEAVEVMTDYAQSLYESKTEVLSYMVAMNAESASTFFVFERYPSEMVAKTLASQERGQSVMLKVNTLCILPCTE